MQNSVTPIGGNLVVSSQITHGITLSPSNPSSGNLLQNHSGKNIKIMHTKLFITAQSITVKGWNNPNVHQLEAG